MLRDCYIGEVLFGDALNASDFRNAITAWWPCRARRAPWANQVPFHLEARDRERQLDAIPAGLTYMNNPHTGYEGWSIGGDHERILHKGSSE